MAVRTVLLSIATALAVTVGCAAPVSGAGADTIADAVAEGAVPELTLTVLDARPHDTGAFTQGLEFADGQLYEGTGRVGRSRLRELDPLTGQVRRQAALPPPLFGEGITVTGSTIWQLTWQAGVAIEWDRATLRRLRQVELPGEGWGICHRDAGPGTGVLVVSDGSDRLYRHDPDTFARLGSVPVRIGDRPLTGLNELECVAGAVWANVYPSDWLVRIDPVSGQVTAVVNAAGLLPEPARDRADVLNGIAAIPGTDRFLITGKLWPTMFVVRFDP